MSLAFLALKTSLREEYRIRSVYNVHKMTLRCQLLGLYTGQLQCYKNNNSVLMNDGSVLVLLNLTCTSIYLPECIAWLKPKIRLINDLHSFFGWSVGEHVIEYAMKVRIFVGLNERRWWKSHVENRWKCYQIVSMSTHQTCQSVIASGWNVCVRTTESDGLVNIY